MYEDFFGMTQEPFPKNVPPEEMYESSALREMAERLREGINRNELAILISEPGCGKNTLLRRLRHENSDTLFIYINGLNIKPASFTETHCSRWESTSAITRQISKPW